MRAWRIASRSYAHTAFTGEGAAKSPGRWNRLGVPVVYLAEHLSTGILEVLVHVDDRAHLTAFAAIEVEIPDPHVEELSELPPDWRQLPEPYPESTQALGLEWALSLRSLALRVPSAVVPVEFNLLLNPRHPAMREVRTGEPQPLFLDPRLLR
ncbi:RES domain protein [Meiothermus luteus]|uniref:RES domain protein n=1 Tax=Meiothermus luteus TaxID=2026184 RepID=A0A399F259_9DEIN|nr:MULTISPECIES: RES family NAD+ phosphorylase [Meiothermus]MCL6531415.1 RES family NAD+ phosphorylase [Meiothermus ruber]RIH90080.1 RES domain protein [Meiothermus luteus]